MTLEITGNILIEMNEILAESFSFLVKRIRDSLMHLERTGKKWDDLSPPQKRKALVEIEDSINNDKLLIKRNRLDFVLNGYSRLESSFANSTFDEIQDILLHIPEDLSEEIDKKITGLFPPIDHPDLEKPKADIRNKLDDEVISKHFNPKSDGKDKDIVVELIIILAFGSKKRTFSKLTFFTEDIGFRKNYESLIEAQKNGELSKDKEIANLCNNAIPSFFVEIAY